VKSGKEIHDFICSVNLGRCTYRDVSFIDEDFLMDRDRAMEMAIWNARELEKPILFSCLTSLKSITQYTTEELRSMGLAGVWVGIESKRADYGKLKNVDVASTIHTMKKAGISVLTSMIIGYDWHDEQGVEDDFQYLISLRPTLSQLMIYSPCPQTPLYEQLLESNRLLTIPYKYHDGFHVLFKHPHFSAERLEHLLINLFEREYEELGPCIFRVLEVQLNGYEAYKESPHPLMQRRALEHKRMCQRFYPLLGLGIAKAPSPNVKDFIKTLRDRIENTMIIPYRKRSMRVFVPFLYHYTKIHDTLIPYRQPVEEVHRYHYS
jgi:hypothetical protein